MKKKLLAIIAVLCMCMLVSVPAFASAEDNNKYNIVDTANILTDEEFRELESRAETVSRSLKFDVVIVDLESLENGYDVEEAALEIYNSYYGYGPEKDGVILLISLEERDRTIISTGYGAKAMNDDACQYVTKQILPDLSDGNYAAAFETFIDETEQIVKQANDGHFYKTPFGFVKSLFISIIVGLVFGLIVVGALTAQLKTVHAKAGASEYVDRDSLNIRVARERFLYRNITKKKIEKNNSSSDGAEHGSATGKF